MRQPLYKICAAALALAATGACDSREPTAPGVAFRLTPDVPSLFVGVSIQLVPAALSGSAVPSAPIKWSTTSPGTVSVEANGRIYGVAPGSATIRALSPDGYAETLVTVLTAATLRTSVATTCGITTSDGLYCWGQNDYGQTGTGSRTVAITTPKKVSGGLTFTTVSIGYEHACGMTAAGPYCWGNNNLGQIGDGTTGTVRTEPTKVSGGSSFTVVETNGTSQLLGGIPCVERICSGHSCSIDASGSLYCWGNGRPLPAPLGLDTKFQSLSLGTNYICGIDRAQTTYCWGGGGTYGQSGGPLGNGTDLPTLPGRHLFQSISAGHGHNCALDFNGDVYCWGANTLGQLGSPSAAECFGRFIRVKCRPEPAKVITDYKFLSVSVGAAIAFPEAPPDAHSCGITTTLQAVCWGTNTSGQLGNGSTGSAATPTPVAGALRFRWVSAGYGHSCGVTVEGDAYCWGANAAGQIGNGALTSSAVPVKVIGGLAFK